MTRRDVFMIPMATVVAVSTPVLGAKSERHIVRVTLTFEQKAQTGQMQPWEKIFDWIFSSKNDKTVFGFRSPSVACYRLGIGQRVYWGGALKHDFAPIDLPPYSRCFLQLQDGKPVFWWKSKEF